MLKVSELPQKSEDVIGYSYIVNGLFGNEDLSSHVRILIKTKNVKYIKLCDYLIKQKTSNNKDETIKVSDLLSKVGVDFKAIS